MEITPGVPSGEDWDPGMFKGLHPRYPYVSAKRHSLLQIQVDNSHDKSQDSLKTGITSIPELCLMVHGLAGLSRYRLGQRLLRVNRP